MTISKTRLRVEMAKCGLSFRGLAEASGVSKATLSYINSGKSCSPMIAGKLAKALGVPVEYLVEEVR